MMMSDFVADTRIDLRGRSPGRTSPDHLAGVRGSPPTDAPKFQQSDHVARDLSGCVGRLGSDFLLAIPPVGAMVMITLFELIGFSSRVAIS